MNKANRVVHSVLDLLENEIKEGISTAKLDKMAEECARDLDTEPAFKGYRGFPNALCISINEEIVHGIPSKRTIKTGDVISVDFGVKYKGFYGDAARTIVVGEANKKIKGLIEKTREALFVGIEVVKIGNRLYDISLAIKNVAEKNKYGIVRQLSGHGIGSTLHEFPPVFNYIDKNVPNIRLQEGVVFALEPMFCLGSGEIELSKDGWTVITADHSISAHWELSVAIINGRAKILK
jgi:methionyl aminopeptidase